LKGLFGRKGKGFINKGKRNFFIKVFFQEAAKRRFLTYYIIYANLNGSK